MTRILYVTDSLIAGGIESQLVELIRQLDRSRFEPHVLVFYKMPTHSPHFLPQLRAAGVPVTTLDLGWSAADKVKAMRQVIAQVWRLRPQIVQAENYHANLLTHAARIFMPPATKLIGTHRGVYTRSQLRYAWMERDLCDVVVASADHLRCQLIEGAGIPAERVVVIPNSVDVTRFGGAAARGVELRGRLAPGARRLFVSVGRISRQKRMDLLAEALGLLRRGGSLLDDVRLVIVGHAQEEAYQRMLDAIIAREGLENIVTRQPKTDEPEVYFAACDASALASSTEGLPVVALESLAAGKPVILSAGANSAGVIEDGETGWVAPTNAPADLAIAIQRMLVTPESELARMAERCRARAAEYSIETLARRYMALYEALADFPRRSHAADRWAALAEATR